MPRTRSLLAVTASLAAAGCVLVAGLVRAGQGATPPSATARAVAADDPAVDVLHAWDERRRGAYASGSTRALGDLYVRGSEAGRHDVQLLSSYHSRGFVVHGVRMQVLEVRVLDSSADRWRLRVTDRLAGGVAVRRGERVPLPRDAASTRVLTLVRGADGRWRVAEVSASG